MAKSSKPVTDRLISLQTYVYTSQLDWLAEYAAKHGISTAEAVRHAVTALRNQQEAGGEGGSGGR